MKGRERWVAAVLFVAAGLACWQAHGATGFWQGLLLNLGATLTGVGIALIIVNVYFDTASKRKAVRPLLMLVVPSIQEHHNRLIKKAWMKIGKPQFGELLDRYRKNDGDPYALSPEERASLYKMVKEGKDDIFPLLDKLETDLRELALVLGWSFNPAILSASFRCRYAIAKLRLVPFDDCEQSMIDTAEHFLDTDIAAFAVFERLIKLVGLRTKDVVGED